MKNIIILILTAVSFCTSAQTAAKNDPLKIPAIPFSLSWDVQPVGYEVSGNGISITAGKETDLYSFLDGNYYVNTAPKLLFTPDTAFIFSAKIKPSFKGTYDGGAILVYSDAENWAKILLEQHEDGKIGLGVSLVKNKLGDDSYHAVVKGNEVYAKVVRSGKVFCFYYSTDGKIWKIVRSFPYEKFENLRIGFYSQSPKGSACTVLFDDIKYKGAAFKDYNTGE
jgi:regulation of enolase protein 1 (concanavalin A-like superfamily)